MACLSHFKPSRIEKSRGTAAGLALTNNMYYEVIMLTLEDYKQMIEEYKKEIDALNAKIAEKEKLMNHHKFATAKDRNENTRALFLLYSMRNDCVFAKSKLIKQVECMQRKR